MSVRMDEEKSFARLVEWYIAQCNGLWEHEHCVIRLITLDNPGFSIEIDLNGTRWKKLPFEEVFVDIQSESGWVHCRKTDDGIWRASCAPRLMSMAIGYFIAWTDAS